MVFKQNSFNIYILLYYINKLSSHEKMFNINISRNRINQKPYIYIEVLLIKLSWFKWNKYYLYKFNKQTLI